MSDFLYNVTMIVCTCGAMFAGGYASMWIIEKIVNLTSKDHS